MILARSDGGNLLFIVCVHWINEQDLDLRGAVGDGHEQCDAEPKSLQQNDNQPLGAIKDHILDGAPPVMLYHTVHKSVISLFIHPSITHHRLATAGSRGGWSLSQLSLGEKLETPWTGRSFITGLTHRDQQRHTVAPRSDLESLI